MPSTRSRRKRAEAKQPVRLLHPVPWPSTGDQHLDLVRAAIEAHLYPHGDYADSTGRITVPYQASLLAAGLKHGMTDAEVGNFLCANVSCGGTSVYRRTADGMLQPAGYIEFSGRSGPADVMGRRPFEWQLTATPAGGAAEAVTWIAADLYSAFRRAFGVPEHIAPPEPSRPAWEEGQGVLF